MGKITYINSGKFRPGYTNTHWIQDGIDDLNTYRSYYGDFEDNGAVGVDISQTLGAFGRNSHALADFYAHSNWIDGPERGGGWFKIPLIGANQRGWVPVDLDKRVLWGETSSPDLYSGTVGLTELKGTFDKSTTATGTRMQMMSKRMRNRIEKTSKGHSMPPGCSTGQSRNMAQTSTTRETT